MGKAVAIAVAVMVILAFFGHAAVAEAAEGVHQGAGAFQHVHALAFDAVAHSLWLGTHAGLFRSEDGGRTWTKLTLPVKHDGPDVMAVTPDPRDAGTVYVATHEAGVLNTADGGRT